MKKKLLGSMLGIAIASTVGQISFAASENTDGKIQYLNGGIVINPEPEVPGTPTPGGNFEYWLPTNLNFGYHSIQSRTTETWVAKEVDTQGITDVSELQTRYDSSADTIGTLGIEDNRGNSAGWDVKVRQAGEFKAVSNPDRTLNATQLMISTGTISNNLLADTTGITGPSNNKLTIDAASGEQIILMSDVGTGQGLTELPLTKFELLVPAGQDKIADIYQADVVWTLSNTP